MGLITCEIHGDNFFVTVSDKLYQKYYSDEFHEINIVKVTFKVSSLDTSFIHYEVLNEHTFNYSTINSFNDFERVFNIKSAYKGICCKCFVEFLKNKKIEVKELLIEI